MRDLVTCYCEYCRLLRRWNGELIPTPEEADVFEQLQMDFVPPNMRDDGRWLEYAR